MDYSWARVRVAPILRMLPVMFRCDSLKLQILCSPPPTLQELGLIRKPASFMTSICDERGQELIYAGMPITEVFKSEIGLGGTLGLLWFQRRSEC